MACHWFLIHERFKFLRDLKVIEAQRTASRFSFSVSHCFSLSDCLSLSLLGSILAFEGGREKKRVSSLFSFKREENERRRGEEANRDGHFEKARICRGLPSKKSIHIQERKKAGWLMDMDNQ